MVLQYVPQYHASNSRKEKNRITHELVQLGYSKGIRFLRRDIYDQWSDADVETVRVRVGQSLRYLHKQQQQKHKQEDDYLVPVNEVVKNPQDSVTLDTQDPTSYADLIQPMEDISMTDSQPQRKEFHSTRRRSSFLRGSFMRRGSIRRESFKVQGPPAVDAPATRRDSMQLDSGFLNVASGDLMMEYETDPLHFSEDFSLLNSAEFGGKSEMRNRMEPFRRSV